MLKSNSLSAILTIRAICHGISHIVGDIAVGKLADLVLWKPENFGVRPEQVVKGGCVAWAPAGDPNGAITTVQPILSRPMWGATARVAASNSYAFVSKVSIDNGTIFILGLSSLCNDFSAIRNHRLLRAEKKGRSCQELPSHRQTGHEVERTDATYYR